MAAGSAGRAGRAAARHEGRAVAFVTRIWRERDSAGVPIPDSTVCQSFGLQAVSAISESSARPRHPAGPAWGMAPELGAGTRGARADDSSPTLDPRVTCDSGETNPDTRAETARRPVWSEADDVPPGLESKASRARARRQWRVAADAFRQWRRRGRVAAGARRALATVGKHRAFARTTVVAALSLIHI